jgi:dephospho-CoA kinase
MTLIGITGTMGAGKGTLVHYLVEHFGFVHYSARAFLVDEVERRDMRVDRDAMIAVANDLRQHFGADYVIRQLHARAQADGRNAIIESVLTVGEAQYLKQHGAILMAVDADRRTRYKRICARQSETDQVSYETFIEQEERKMHSDDPGKHDVAGVIAMADIALMNNGTREEFERSVEKAYASLVE